MAIMVDDLDNPLQQEDMEETVGAAMAEVISERLEGARQNLRRRAIEGEGDCMFRAVAVQGERYGHEGQSMLRHAAVAYVDTRRNLFIGFSAKRTKKRHRTSGCAQ